MRCACIKHWYGGMFQINPWILESKGWSSQPCTIQYAWWTTLVTGSTGYQIWELSIILTVCLQVQKRKSNSSWGPLWQACLRSSSPHFAILERNQSNKLCLSDNFSQSALLSMSRGGSVYCINLSGFGNNEHSIKSNGEGLETYQRVWLAVTLQWMKIHARKGLSGQSKTPYRESWSFCMVGGYIDWWCKGRHRIREQEPLREVHFWPRTNNTRPHCLHHSQSKYKSEQPSQFLVTMVM